MSAAEAFCHAAMRGVMRGRRPAAFCDYMGRRHVGVAIGQKKVPELCREGANTMAHKPRKPYILDPWLHKPRGPTIPDPMVITFRRGPGGSGGSGGSSILCGPINVTCHIDQFFSNEF